MDVQPRYLVNLRTKTAEWEALRLLRAEVRNNITPCLDVLPAEVGLIGAQASSGLPETMNRFSRRVVKTWGAAPVFVDLSRINPVLRSDTGDHPVAMLSRSAKAYKMNGTVTVGLYHDPEFYAAVRDAVQSGHLQAAIRVHFADLEKENSHDLIDGLVQFLKTTYAGVDVVVDLDVVDETPPNYDQLCSRIPNLHEWRRFIVTGGSFPVNLEGLPIGSRCQPRYDWMHWQGWASGPNVRGSRVPDFSDYTVQHAIYYEPPGGANPSASIRYATDNYWLIMRGGPLRSKKTTGYQQYYGNAQLLCERDEFGGPEYSFGDKYIADVASHLVGPGTPTTWLIAAINRHMTLTAKQVAAM